MFIIKACIININLLTKFEVNFLDFVKISAIINIYNLTIYCNYFSIPNKYHLLIFV
jgi:hypothetical protein